MDRDDLLAPFKTEYVKSSNPPISTIHNTNNEQRLSYLLV